MAVSSPDETLKDMLSTLRDMPRPGLSVMGPSAFSAGQRAVALEGRFNVFRRTVALSPPIDWQQDPYDSRSWRYELHTLMFLGALLHRYNDEGDAEAIRRAADIALDWVRQNPLGGDGLSEFAWYDMAVGIRGPHLAYVLRAGLHDDVLAEPEALELLRSVQEHGTHLADDRHYADAHNHGLFQDTGLLQLCGLAPCLPEAEEWQAHAVARAVANLKATVDWNDGAHLEHSPTYQYVITHLVERLVNARPHASDELAELLTRLRRTASWFVTPDGRVAAVGDSEASTVPNWARELKDEAVGGRAFLGAGYAVVKIEDSYLMCTAQYHSSGHKQADELSFVLWEHGEQVVGEAGRYGYYEDEPGRIYARSSHAHNTLVVDDKSFEWAGRKAYGSGIVALAEHSGRFALEGRNVLLEQDGVRHRRLLLYAPRVLLLIVDRVESDDEHEYTRYLHCGRTIAATDGPDGVLLGGTSFTGTYTDWTQGTTCERELVRGRTSGRLQGWTFPSDRDWVPTWTITSKSRAASALFVACLAAGAAAPEHVTAAWDDDACEVSTHVEGRSLRWRYRGGELTVDPQLPVA
jgi:hypothetical protein